MTAPACAPEPKWFVFRGPWRAEFETLDGALTWCREHGGTVTTSPTNSAEPSRPTAGNIAMADLCGSSCGEE